ncbi:50S ribosomal protein L4 [Candidatus Saccharibacteria bacterium]|nr:50S ribosomal protein L4 [Candidatus Saccharibacteria bacterium]MBR0372430.1 50S ribosomal protein L4 [Candidatus Saccharibacteria bacterium]
MVALNKEIFGLTVENHELVKLAYDSYLANSRSSHAKTLKRGEVRGGGKKPWRQKGTGRARFGSTRNPIWRHGGVAFGRTGNENFTKKIAKSSKLLAVRQALSMKNADKSVFVLGKEVKLTGKTKDAVKVLKDMKLEGKNVLAVCSEKTPEVLRSTNNLPNLKLVRATYLNVFDIMNADAIVFSEEALKVAEKWLIGEEK